MEAMLREMGWARSSGRRRGRPRAKTPLEAHAEFQPGKKRNPVEEPDCLSSAAWVRVRVAARSGCRQRRSRRLSIPLPAEDESKRFKSVVHSSPKVWMHHLEIRDPDQVDDEVARWLRDASVAAA